MYSSDILSSELNDDMRFDSFAIEVGPHSFGATMQPANSSSMVATLPAPETAMTSIIPDPGPRTTIFNVGSEIYVDGAYVVNAGQIKSTRTVDNMFRGGYNDGSLTNNGEIWSQTVSQTYGTFSIANFGGEITNNGLIVIEANNIEEYNQFARQEIFVFSTQNDITNTGQIFALVTNGNATGVTASLNTFDNSGLLAVQATIGSAVAVEAGDLVINGANGQILAEGEYATAVNFDRGSHSSSTATNLNNAGQIEAATATIEPSFAVRLQAIAPENYRVVNSGTIKGDFAIYVDVAAVGGNPVATQDTIINEIGGLIDGDISLAQGDDEIINSGTITGYVDLGENDDLFDNQNGMVNGTVDLSLGDDVFLGGNSADYATGNRGDDELTGGGGNDLLVGGYGQDILDGGTGNDSLYGEFGDDLITTSAADYVDAGTGDDRVTTSDLTFEQIYGGAGHDVWVTTDANRLFDLSKIVNSQRVYDFEEIELNSGSDIIVRASDVVSITGEEAKLLVSVGSGSSTVHLVGSWTVDGTGTNDLTGDSFNIYRQGDAAVWVENEATVSIVASPPAGGLGLNAVAGGASAPIPGPNTVELTDPNTLLINFAFSSDTTVDEGEVWYNNGQGTVVQTFANVENFWNYGTIRVINVIDPFYTQAFGAENLTNFYNHGTITATTTLPGEDYFSTTALNLAPFGNAVNTGNISARAIDGQVNAFFDVGTLDNSGFITARSDNGSALGVPLGHSLTNSGTISTLGNTGSVAITLISSYQTSINTGQIEAMIIEGGTGQAIAVELGQVWAANNNPWNTVSFQNSGEIEADIAFGVSYRIAGAYDGSALNLTNDAAGTIIGDFDLSDGIDQISNSGSITGDISFGRGNDVYNGTNGRLTGTIFGGLGHDTLNGGLLGETFSGGPGNDIIDGAGGIDTVSYADAGRRCLGKSSNHHTAKYASRRFGPDHQCRKSGRIVVQRCAAR